MVTARYGYTTVKAKHEGSSLGRENSHSSAIFHCPGLFWPGHFILLVDNHLTTNYPDRAVSGQNHLSRKASLFSKLSGIRAVRAVFRQLLYIFEAFILIVSIHITWRETTLNALNRFKNLFNLVLTTILILP